MSTLVVNILGAFAFGFTWSRQYKLAGATVLRGYLSFGANSRIHSARVLRLSEDLPMVIESVGELDGLIQEGLVTLETVEVVTCRHNGMERV